MLYEDKIKKDINLKITKTATVNNFGERIVEFKFDDFVELKGQIAIFSLRKDMTRQSLFFQQMLKLGTMWR